MSKDNKTDEKTYVVYCHTCPDGKVYYGCTCNIKRRWKPSEYKGTSLEPYIDKYGWKNINHQVVRENLNRIEALRLENELIVNGWSNGACININHSGNYKQTEQFKDAEKARIKARHESHKEEDNARSMAWQKANPEKRKAIDKRYRETHPEECKSRRKARYEKNKEEEIAYNKAYREANKDRINERRRENYKRKKGGGDKPEPLF